jgi:hypothetical protein
VSTQGAGECGGNFKTTETITNVDETRITDLEQQISGKVPAVMQWICDDAHSSSVTDCARN